MTWKQVVAGNEGKTIGHEEVKTLRTRILKDSLQCELQRCQNCQG